MKKRFLRRLDEYRLAIDNPYGIPGRLFANSAVPLQNAALEELQRLLEVHDTAQRWYEMQPQDFAIPPMLTRVAITPDFHKGSGIPIGTVLQTEGFIVPQAIGSDINCGMRLHATDFKADEVINQLDALEAKLRLIFFRGGRNIPMSSLQRQALLIHGLQGLIEAVPRSQNEGLWALWHRLDWRRDLERIDQRGCVDALRCHGFEDWIGRSDLTPYDLSRDAQIGSIGGGNHFVEVQRIERIFDRVVAHQWGLKEGMVTVMVHTGSLGLGAQSAALMRQMIQTAWPKDLPKPSNGIGLLPMTDTTLESDCWDALGNAANFAFANRAMLALMALQGLEEVLGETNFPLLYDAPHNLVWRDQNKLIHRKGATPARGLEQSQNTPFAFTGEPVLVPGSMGSSSFIMAGLGNAEALQSASHGAGRALSRGQAARGFEAEFAGFLESFRVVIPMDWRRARADVRARKLEELKQEAPHAYKNILPVVETLEGGGLARRIAEVKPLLTIKG